MVKNFGKMQEAMKDAGSQCANLLDKCPPDSAIRAYSFIAYCDYCKAMNEEYSETDLGSAYRSFRDGVRHEFGFYEDDEDFPALRDEDSEDPYEFSDEF
jgi:hypothetical protein